MSCVLRVSGKSFDVDAFLAVSPLTPCNVFHAGAPRRPALAGRSIHENSGFNADVSDGSWDDLREQVAAAIAFLEQHREELERLRSAPGVEDMRLDFGIDLRIDREKVFTQFDYFPPALVSLAGALGLGLELSLYPRDLEELAAGRPEP